MVVKAVVVESVVTKVVVVEVVVTKAAVEVGDGVCSFMTLGLLFTVAIKTIFDTHIVTSNTNHIINL